MDLRPLPFWRSTSTSYLTDANVTYNLVCTSFLLPLRQGGCFKCVNCTRMYGVGTFIPYTGYQTTWITVITHIDRTKSIYNCCVIETLDCVFVVFLWICVCIETFVKGLGHIPSLLSILKTVIGSTALGKRKYVRPSVYLELLHSLNMLFCGNGNMDAWESGTTFRVSDAAYLIDRYYERLHLQLEYSRVAVLTCPKKLNFNRPIISIVFPLRHAHCCVSSYQSNSRPCASTTRVGVRVQMTQF